MTGENTETKIIHIRGMFCTHCEKRIKDALLSVPGVMKAVVSYETGSAEITAENGTVNVDILRKVISDAGYKMDDEEHVNLQSISILIILLAFWLLARHFGWTKLFNSFSRVKTSLSLGALFLTGAMTSIHCIAMCGGINLTQSVIASVSKNKLLRVNGLYQIGRLTSYTLTGAIVGEIGSVLSLNGMFKGVVAVIAGCAMVIMALNMLGSFKPLRKLHFRMPAKLYNVVFSKIGAKSSFFIGLLNGLMPCGPLQSMQLYALSTGNAVKGALSMFIFGLGTVPLMLGFGLISAGLNRKYTRIMLTVSAMLIFVMGLNMAVKGLTLSGVSLPNVVPTDVIQAMQTDYGQILRTEIDYGSYPAVRVKVGIPVYWTIVVPEGKLNGCNGELLIPELDIDVVLREGENNLEFTADSVRKIPYSCWMGMIRSVIEVVE